MKKRIFNLIIVDESGSMATIEQPTVSGINETLQSIRHTNSELKDAESYVTLIAFSSNEVRTIYDCINAEEAADLTEEQYSPNGCTPLYDAIGNGIHSLQKKIAPADSAFVTIITDGYENSSREFNHAAVRKLIEDKKKADWVFTFIGADIDVEKTSRDLGIHFCASFEKTNADTRAVWSELNEEREELIKCCDAAAPGTSMNEMAIRHHFFSKRRKK